MRSHVRTVKAPVGNYAQGDYAISMDLLDETSWSPTSTCNEEDFYCALPMKTVGECVGDYCAAQLPLSDFSGRDLTNARFSGSELSCANFRKAKLESADFSNSDLCQACLINADLRGANFESADLSFADLRFSDLRGANFHDVRFVDVDVKGARFDRKTVLPISRDEAETRGMIYCF